MCPSSLPHPPTAVIQVINKEVAPERFTEHGARAVRAIVPSVAAGSRLIFSLLNFGRNLSGKRALNPCTKNTLLHHRVRCAHEEMSADRARVFLLCDGDENVLRLRLEDPTPQLQQSNRGSLSPMKTLGVVDETIVGEVTMAAGAGLLGHVLATERAARSSDALSNSVCDNEQNIQERFQPRSIIYAPLLLCSKDRNVDKSGGHHHGNSIGVLELAIRCRTEGDNEPRNIIPVDSGGAAFSGGGRKHKQSFVEADE